MGIRGVYHEHFKELLTFDQYTYIVRSLGKCSYLMFFDVILADLNRKQRGYHENYTQVKEFVTLTFRPMLRLL